MRARRCGVSFAAGALVVCGLSGSAWAQAGDRAVADALFEKGRAAMEAEDFATACAAFEESNRLDPAPGTMANLADCEEHREHLASALDWYQRAASKLPEGDERRTIAERRAAEVKARMPMLTIRLAPGTPPSARVVRDATEFRSVSLGLPLPIDPGTHDVVVTAPGYPEGRYRITIEEKELKEIVVGLGTNQPPGGAPMPAPAPGAAPASAPPPAADTGSGKGDHKTLGFVLLGVGGVGVGTALVLGGVALGKKSTVKDHCNTSTHVCDSQDAVDAASSGKSLTTASTVSFVLGAAAGGLGLYFVLSSKGDGASTAVGGGAIPGGGFLRVSERF